MDLQTHRLTPRSTFGVSPQRTAGHSLVACLVAFATVGLHVPTDDSPVHDVQHSGAPEADLVADHAGGTAARLYDPHGRPLAGDVFLLIGSSSSAPDARSFDATPYTHDRGTHPDIIASNLLAAETVRTITGSDVEPIEMTNGPGGGTSGGLTRAIAYLNVLSDGAFSGDLRIAVTGELSPEGHVSAIDDIDAKTAAAHLAGADVLFTPTLPTSRARDAYGARVAGEFVRDLNSGRSLNDPRRIERFHRWGAVRPAGMDIIDVRHLIDVSSYLCGAGSAFACDIVDRLDRHAQQRLDQLTEDADHERQRFSATIERSGADR